MRALISGIKGIYLLQAYHSDHARQWCRLLLNRSIHKRTQGKLNSIQLAQAIGAGGATGEAAANVAKALHPHFLKEEEYALPPLGVLPALAKGKVLPEMEAAVAMAYRLKADLGHMLQEHKDIVSALEALKEAASSEGKAAAAHFAEKLVLHAQTEEEVLYPAAILVGEYLNLKLSEKMGR